MVNFHRVASGESIVELINAPKMSSGGPQVQRSTINRLLSLARIWYSWSRSAHGVSESFPFTRGLTDTPKRRRARPRVSSVIAWSSKMLENNKRDGRNFSSYCSFADSALASLDRDAGGSVFPKGQKGVAFQ